VSIQTGMIPSKLQIIGVCLAILGAAIMSVDLSFLSKKGKEDLSPAPERASILIDKDKGSLHQRKNSSVNDDHLDMTTFSRDNSSNELQPVDLPKHSPSTITNVSTNSKGTTFKEYRPSGVSKQVLAKNFYR
jgi:hypothetical protein